MTSFNVTEVRNALRCPRVFALGRIRGNQVAFPIGASALGGTFHRIAERLHAQAADPPAALTALPDNAPADTIAEVLKDWVLGYLAETLVTNAALQSMPTEVDELAEALREFAQYLAERVAARPEGPATALAAYLKGAEIAVEQVLGEKSQEPVRLSGRVDAIFEPEAQLFEVAEYKLTDEDNEELDSAQVALYRQMLRWDRGVDATPVVLRFTPTLSTTRLAPEAADRLAERELFPLIQRMVVWEDEPLSAPATQRKDLCPSCPVRDACRETYSERLAQRDEPPSSAWRPRPDPTGEIVLPPEPERPKSVDGDEVGEREASTLANAIAESYRSQGVHALVKPPRVGARLITLEVSVQRGSINQIDRRKDDVLHSLEAALEIKADFERQRSLRIFRVARRQPRDVQLAPLIERERAWLSERPGRFVLGESTEGDVIRGDLGDHSSCHLLVAGMTGSGKSVLLKGIVASLVELHDPSSIQLTLVDPKRVTFGGFANSVSAYLARPLAYETEQVLTLLEELNSEMDERYRAFEPLAVENLDDYNDSVKTPQRLPRQVLVVDEFQDLVTTKTTAEPFFALVSRLGAKARAAGIHLILATQRPDAKVVPGRIKANLTGRIALRVPEAINSRIILDRKGAEQLLGRGDMLVNLSGETIRGQAPRI
ncbi:MAG: PD-(D/E)XK nuclease family protein [Polyangiaceae bacterium]|nr:PD-(D/E)XK nuclease family protein [Myxococcales bacterium]MCB9589658.1 PD-(D/E)XK nuclease family protein [Polyangiaceae bacterium]